MLLTLRRMILEHRTHSQIWSGVLFIVITAPQTTVTLCQVDEAIINYN